MTFVLLNPLSNNKQGENAKPLLEELLKNNNKQYVFKNITEMKNMKEFFETLKDEDEIIIAGGDGTLSTFINECYDLKLEQKIYLFPCGSGNDFAHDIEPLVKKGEVLIEINRFIQSLPTVTVNGITKRFINGIGFGIDGYCCEKGDDLRTKSDKPVNYTAIAIKGLLGKFHPSNAKITIDGNEKNYKSVWLAPTMIGKYYGGGMDVAPEQNRLNKEKTVSLVVWHSKNKLKTLCVFPSIFKGEHVSHKEMIEIYTGHNVTVEFDKPQALQIDGETIRNVTKYSVNY